MKEKLYTIPVNEGFEADDECPFCAMERQAERSAIRYFAGPGASYMEPDVRATTDAQGFCGNHLKKLYDYGNTLGSALMLQTYYAGLLKELHEGLSDYELPIKKGLFSRKTSQQGSSPYWQQLESRLSRCAICEKVEYNMDRYYATFFCLLKEEDFRDKVLKSKGFCLRHLTRLLKQSEERLPESQKIWFQKELLPMAEENLLRVKEDLDWLIAKYDYQNANKPWGNAQDALPRAMQKLRGIYPSDEPYKEK